MGEVMRELLTLILLCLFLTSCEVYNSSNSNIDLELSEATEMWNSYNLQNYTFVNSRSCECLPPYDYTVEVVNGEINDIYFDLQKDINYEKKDRIISTTRTIDELFDLLVKYEETADQFEVEFNEEFGYPTNIKIDPSREIADEEIILEISKLLFINN